VDELSALLGKKAAPSGSAPTAAASAAAAYMAFLETGISELTKVHLRQSHTFLPASRLKICYACSLAKKFKKMPP
jgi:hypothetical protein